MRIYLATALLALAMTACTTQEHPADANGAYGQGSGPSQVGQGSQTGSADAHGRMSSAAGQQQNQGK